MQIANPAKWTAETPNLYQLLLELKDGQGKTIEVTSHPVGFREVEIRDGQLRVNGQPIISRESIGTSMIRSAATRSRSNRWSTTSG